MSYVRSVEPLHALDRVGGPIGLAGRAACFGSSERHRRLHRRATFDADASVAPATDVPRSASVNVLIADVTRFPAKRTACWCSDIGCIFFVGTLPLS